jgi:hypothetical protein
MKVLRHINIPLIEGLAPLVLKGGSENIQFIFIIVLFSSREELFVSLGGHAVGDCIPS